MKVRVGVDAAVEDAVLRNFTQEAQLVRIAKEPKGDVEVDFWIPLLSPKIVQSQWQYLKGVRVVQAPWAGIGPFLEMLPPGVVLCDAQGVHDIPTAEWTLSAILAMQRCLPFYVELQTQGKWGTGLQAQQIDLTPDAKIENPPVPINEVAGATVLIVGYGSIGKAVESRLAPFGVKFLRVAHSPREGVYAVAKLDELLSQADIVVITAPLTSETKHLFNASRLSKMKPQALLVNAGRGGIVDTEALLQTLNGKKIRAAIDVTDPEPLPAGHPLWKAPNLLITPHVGGDSDKFMGRVFKLASEQVDRFAHGEPLLNVVTGEY
jgi:phosphoglycerate dehydrogenase-like enzyme